MVIQNSTDQFDPRERTEEEEGNPQQQIISTEETIEVETDIEDEELADEDATLEDEGD